MKDPRTKVMYLFKNGEEVAKSQPGDAFIDIRLIEYIHKNHSFSFEHALQYEGYNIRIKYELPDMSWESHEVISIMENHKSYYNEIQAKLKKFKEKDWFNSFYWYIKNTVSQEKSWFKSLNEELDLRRISPKHIAWWYWYYED